MMKEILKEFKENVLVQNQDGIMIAFVMVSINIIVHIQ